jgi:AcrR family transcriptional regulator
MKTENVREKILQTVLSLEVSKGHLKWKVSDLARLTKASRPLVYYHFGKTKQQILDTCIETIAIDYFGLGEDRKDTLKSGLALESLMQTRAMFLKNPSLVVFYQKWRMQPGPVCKQLMEIEKKYQAKIKEAFPFLTSAQIVAVHGLFHGLISAPFMNDEALRESYSVISNWIRSLRR